MKRSTCFAFAMVTAASLSACSTGELRAFNDSLAQANGNEVYYADQMNCGAYDDLQLCNGVQYGSAFWEVRNHSGEYCKAHVHLENGTQETVRLNPGQDMQNSGSVYNQAESIEYVCDRDSNVHNARLNNNQWTW